MINRVTPRIRVVHTQCCLSPINLNDRTHLDVGPVQTKISYINKTGVDLSLIERSGLRYTVPSEMNIGTRVFIIRTETRIQRNALDEISKFLQQHNTTGDNLSKIKFSILENKNKTTWDGLAVYIDHEIDIDEINNAGGSIYVKPKDVVLSRSSIYNAPPHPYSEDSISDYVLQNEDPPTPGSPYFRLELIDNDNSIANRFISVFGDLHELVPKQDENRENGIYYSRVVKSLNIDLPYSVDRKKYSFKDAEEALGIYRTKEEALSFGDIKNARKEALVELEHQINLMKSELQNKKIENDAITADNERTISDIEFSRKLEEAKYQERIRILEREKAEIEHLRELEKNMRKDYYENRSYERKDQSEIVKFIPYMIMGIGAVIVAFMKLSPTK